MKDLSYFLLPSALVCLFFVYQKKESFTPIPTNGRTVIKMGEEEVDRDQREAWLALMHQSAPGTDWRGIEHRTQMARHRERTQKLRTRSGCGVELLAGNRITGKWNERGSSNLAGSVFDTEYDAATDEIWILSAGGTLWKGSGDGSNWQVVNQDLEFNPGLLQFIPHGAGRRLLAFAGRIPHFSDDEGMSWTPAAGISHDDSWGNFSSPVVLNDAAYTFYVLAKPSYWNPVSLYKSTDQGEHFHLVKTFESHEFERHHLTQPIHSHQLLLTKKTEEGEALIYRIDPVTDEMTLLNPDSDLAFGDTRANLTGTMDNNAGLLLYCHTKLDNENKLMRSEDGGSTWEVRGTLPIEPWSVGIYLTPSDPNTLFFGEVNCYRSTDAGMNWELINEWWEYYDDPVGKLHADMMHFREFTKASGEPFLLVSHHGGLTQSGDYLASQQNISTSGLHVSQYYSVRTDPIDPNFVYAGSQDQGFQMADAFESGEDGAETFYQVISGDYGHLVFTNDGQSLWMVYPGGWVVYYEDAQSGIVTASYSLESEHESVWLPPLLPSPYPGDNAIYLAGGNQEGGEGSFLIRLDPEGHELIPSQGTFDFWLESGGGAISALATAPSNPDHWYIATTNGRVFFSTDSGNDWQQSLNFVPEGHYLYGQKLLVSAFDEQTVFLGGSGYSGFPVYRSLDGGVSFQPMAEGLPNTLTFDLAASPDQAYLFAATEAGPYVYVQEAGRWYDLSGDCAPAQTYWSVEYLAASHTVRFGTYGRGIWDFNLVNEVAVDAPVQPASPAKLFPNPAHTTVILSWQPDQSGPIPVHITNLAGQRILSTSIEGIAGVLNEHPLDIHALTAGVYLVQFGTGRDALKLVVE